MSHVSGARRATKVDEASVDEMVHEQISLEQLAARRRRAVAKREAQERKRGEAIVRRRLEQEELEAEARTEAKQELVAEGLLSAPKKKTAQQAHKELLIKKKKTGYTYRRRYQLGQGGRQKFSKVLPVLGLSFRLKRALCSALV